MKRIGLYISAFDPIHSGHINFAEDALRKHKLERLYFLVEPRPRYRQGVKSLNHRVNMAILGVAQNPKLGTIVSDPTANVEDYIKTLQSRFDGKRIALIIPDYALKRFFNLHNILSNDFNNLDIIIGLNDNSAEEIDFKLQLLSQTSGIKFNYSWYESGVTKINTLEVKKKLKQGLKPDEVPGSVYDYIVNEKLYAASSSA